MIANATIASPTVAGSIPRLSQVAEAVNFAPPDCLPFMRNALTCYRHHRHTPVLSVERVLLRLAMRSHSGLAAGASTERLDPSTADWLLPELEEVVEQELAERDTLPPAQRRILTIGHEPRAATRRASFVASFDADEQASQRAKQLRLLSHCTDELRMLEDDQLTCVECNRPLYFSGVTCVTGGPPRGGGVRGGTGGSYRDKQLSKSEAEEAPGMTPPSACLIHAKALRKLCMGRQTGASAGPDGSARELDEDGAFDGGLTGPTRGGAMLVAWQRHNDSFLRSLCARVAKRATEAD